MNDNNNFSQNKPNEFGSTPNEFSRDFIIETEKETPVEFVTAPEEYGTGYAENTDTGIDSIETETAAASDENYNDLSGAYGNDSDDNYDEYYNEVSDTYDLETADDRNSAWHTETAEDYGYETDDDYAYETAEDVNPDDETAATADEFYSADKPSAREKCRLDDYEIISDVLGAEKQIVKLYTTALCEAAEEPFRNILRENLDYAAEDQYKAFEFMQNRGMYKTEQASDNDISEAKKSLSPLAQNENCDCNDCFCNTVKNNCNNGSCDIK